jgi:hypothetical protein
MTNLSVSISSLVSSNVSQSRTFNTRGLSPPLISILRPWSTSLYGFSQSLGQMPLASADSPCAARRWSSMRPVKLASTQLCRGFSAIQLNKELSDTRRFMDMRTSFYPQFRCRWLIRNRLKGSRFPMQYLTGTMPMDAGRD